jgi:PAS domain S-box-containing protein
VWDTASARIVTAIDVTERKRAEERMREQADIIERAHDAVIVRNFSDDIVTVWNNGAEHLYGWSATEAIGQPMGELIFAESDDRRAGLDQLVSAGEFHGELKHCAKDGREVIVDSRVTLIRNDDGTPRAVLGINTDITEQKKLETQLLRAQRLESIGTLASGVAHDLNNILTPILMCAEVLRGEVSNEDRQSAVALIDQSARRGANVVKQVLTFARGVEGERVVINPRHLLEEMVDIARKTFPKSIEVTARYPEELWSVEGDPTQLHQVLLNLCVNARDAMPDGGALTLAAENVDLDESYAATMPDAKVGPHVLLRVSDTGTGMPRATIDKIFDPFFTTKQIGKGTGLGLSTALGIVKSHRGFLALYSEPGRGTTFRIFLPATGIEPAAVKPTTSQLVQGNNELILVIDDEEGIRRVTTNTLEKNNYRALEAKDGPEALALFAQQMDSIQLVITDLMLPYMDGLALARALTKMKPDIAIIASTGQGEQTSMSELQSLGVKNFLSKPYDSERLLRTVHEALTGARS